MSDNPFDAPKSDFKAPAPAPLPTMQSTPAKRMMPGGVKAVAIICLLLGLLGLVGGCMNGLMIGFSEPLFNWLMSLIPEDAPNQMENKEFGRMGLAAQASVLIPGIVLLVIGLVVATMLILGSIGALRGKSVGVLNLGLLAAIFYSFLKIGMGIYGQIHTRKFLQNAVDNYTGDADPEVLQRMLASSSGTQGLIGLIVGIAFVVFLLIFYIWAKFYIKSERVTKYFESA